MSTPQFQIKSLLLLVLLLFSGRTFGQPMLGSDASPERERGEVPRVDLLRVPARRLQRLA
jgi:hypothetical protein